MTLREAWTKSVAVEDYEAHMANVGQAQANALLVRDLLERAHLPDGSRILIAGAGTGQMFDYLSATTFERLHLTFSDINERFLARLRERLDCETIIDDVEDTRLDPGFTAILLVLVLEHVDFRKALTSLASLSPRRFLTITQQNPPAMTSAVTPGRPVAGTMRVFAEEAQPRLVPFPELEKTFAGLGFALGCRQEVAVADAKKMIGAIWTYELTAPSVAIC